MLTELVGVSLICLLLVGGGFIAVKRDSSGSDSEVPQAQEVVTEETESETKGTVADVPQPDIQSTTYGLLEKYWKIHRAHKKRRKLARKGYVRWFLIDQTFPEPKFVKPEMTEAGLPEVRHGDVPYVFPKSAMIADERTGMATFVHKKGDAEPINLQDPAKQAIPAKVVDEWQHKNLERDAPSWWDNVDFSAKQIMAAAMAFVIVIAVVYPMLPG